MTVDFSGRFVGADLIVFNAKITTQDPARPEASALAVKRGRIYSVGSDAEILGLKDDDTQVIDADGKRLIPGINDAHIHVLNERNYNFTVRWEGVPTLERALDMLRDQAERTPEGHWVRVIGGWSPYQFEENRHPTVAELNEAVPNRPAIVQYAYNRAILNGLAMEALGVGTPNFPMLPDTVLETDDHGAYTGVVEAFTWTFVAMEGYAPQPSFDEEISSLIYVVNDLNSFGVTSVLETGAVLGFPEGHTSINTLAVDNKLNVRFSFVDLGFDPATGDLGVDRHIHAVTEKSPISAGDNIHPTMVHGHEYEGMGEEFRGDLHDHENFDRPAVILDHDAMRQSTLDDVTKLVERRIPFRRHLSYNENITPFLDALEEVNKTTPLDGLRWGLEHAETITPENIERVKNLGGGIALDAKMALHGDGFSATYSKEKAQQTPPLRALVASGVPLALTSDGYRASNYNPWIGIGWAVSGKSVSGSEVLGKDNRLSREEALKLYTLGGSWFSHQEHEKGRIAPGNLADFALLSADYFTVPEDEIQKISSLLTVVDGRVVYGAVNYSDLSPELPDPLPEWSPIKHFGGYYNAARVN
ncbi:transcriptional regulator [Rhodococcus sp. 06-462-5]|uniref:amidohydrolase n=1 Tax=unclassified Rhodococcus (in: high G+C Gram-positive bacteria) TaxID=192944 RepID=UPI000B9BCBBE|nr:MULTISPECIES: amidohydrolase [unclassified Rhodococcus (in: high G+C Gram-positive bacteria)]OZC73597.1 transcriptional regulator [Rhodococcus sp. 06-462-5]OZE63406.1 transcriptional regulator [Rhodococcus sp. 02-925g]